MGLNLIRQRKPNKAIPIGSVMSLNRFRRGKIVIAFSPGWNKSKYFGSCYEINLPYSRLK
jgi:hypothetical protein